MTTLVAIVPSAGVLFLFWVAIRAIVQADRRERVAQARLEAAEDAAAAAEARLSAGASRGATAESGVLADGEESPAGLPDADR